MKESKIKTGESIPAAKVALHQGGKESSVEERIPQDIEDVISGVYTNVAQREGISVDDVYSRGWCMPVVPEIYKALSSRYGIDLQNINAGGHYFLLLKKGGVWWVIDPTWQQFLDSPGDGLPRILWVKADNVAEELSRLGVPAEKQKNMDAGT